MRVLAGLVTGALFALSASAQTSTPTAADQTAYESAFQESLRKPNDPPTVMR